MKKSRIHTLDYLRGIAAVGVMMFHYCTWEYGEFKSDTFLGKVGMFGVSIFYMLSGLTLYHVYFRRLNSWIDLQGFYWKRFVRIYPLLWLVTLLTIVLILRRVPDLYVLFLNVTGLFGLLAWDRYIGTGVWSIGNELVFYLLFPALVFLGTRHKAGFWIVSLVIFAIFAYYTFSAITANDLLTHQWRIYINPLNQAAYFLIGFLIGYLFEGVQLSWQKATAILVISFAAFVLFPVSGNHVNLVTGFNRVAMTTISASLCFGFYKFALPHTTKNPLNILGECSYSIYLLHPIARWLTGWISGGFKRYIVELTPEARIAIGVAVTLIMSWVSYNYFEKYFMKRLKR